MSYSKLLLLLILILILPNVLAHGEVVHGGVDSAENINTSNTNINVPLTEYNTAVIYYNEACSMCSMYLKMELIPLLKELGIKEIILKDYVNEKQNRIELNELNKQYMIMPTMQGHFEIFIDKEVFLGGHVPKQIVVDLLTTEHGMDKILVLQDEMADAKSYFAWGFKGEPKEYKIDEPIYEYINWFELNEDSLSEPEDPFKVGWKWSNILPLIISTGFLDGINPCAFAVLLFFIAFLYTIRKTKTNVWKMGIAYILAIFIAYFLIGLGLMKAFIFTGSPHLMAKISAYLLIGLGILSLANFILPKKVNLGVPKFSKHYLKIWMYKATIPAALIVGFLVGLCTFPCSGGMYVAIIGLLAAKTTYNQGLVYLVIYNIMFVMPLVIILLTASSKKATDKIARWESSQSKVIKLVSGVIMIALGLAILFWFI